MPVTLPAFPDEDFSFEGIMQRMLASFPADFDKSEGSLLWDLLSPAAIELAQAAILGQQVIERSFASTTFGTYLDLKAGEQGVIRKGAVAAAGTVTFTGTEGATIPAGTRVSTASTETVSAAVFTTDQEVTIAAGQTTVNVAVTAEVAGASGIGAGAIQFLVEPVNGITSVTNAASTTGGADEESDEGLLSRYFLEVQRQPSSGNPAHYIKLAREVTGISDARVLRAWNGPGTVKVVLISEDNRTPSAAAVAEVTALVEENRPINADVTVVGATEVMINISATLTLKTGGVLADAIEQIRVTVGDYIEGLPADDLIVRYTKIGEAILSAEDVLDYTNLTVNNGTANIEMQQDQVPVMGAVTMN